MPSPNGVVALCDANNFYASCACLYNPEIREKPVVVGGDEGARHGIVLSKNYHAKRFGIQTAETLNEARRKCRDLVVVRADFDLYLRFAKKLWAIYHDYTPLVEPYGIDECYLDLTGSTRLFGGGKEIGDDIRRRVREELGITVTVGVSFNKVFAKLASDLIKPDATVLITKENYKETAWPLPASRMIFVGSETYRKLLAMDIYTIGDLAKADEERLKLRFGKNGLLLKIYANGYDMSPVDPGAVPVNGVSHSNTLPYDATTPEEVRSAIYMLSEGVAIRLRSQGLKCNGVQIYIRDNEMASVIRQGQLQYPTYLAGEIAAKGFEVFTEKYRFVKPIRTIGVKAISLQDQFKMYQLDLFGDHTHRERLERAEQAMDDIRARFGKNAVMKAGNLGSKDLTGHLGHNSETNPLIELYDIHT
ncbi:MAG: DNA polymerase IV [Clostridiales bacterium]|jgi:DNA polymerase-4|nr:DNA polymerase IV [Clostridiales bacterium]